MKTSNNFLLHIALISIYIKFCACSCADKHDDAITAYNECMDDNIVQNMYLVSTDSLGPKELCTLFDLSLKCTKKGRTILKNCSDWQETQIKNHIEGLKVYRTRECPDKEPDRRTEAEIVICETTSQAARDACDKRFSYDYTMFLPTPVVELKIDKESWTEKDCVVKFQWADCWIREYGKCRSVVARLYYGDLLINVLRAYPSCKKSLGKDLENYDPNGAISLTIYYYLLLLLAIIHFNL